MGEFEVQKVEDFFVKFNGKVQVCNFSNCLGGLVWTCWIGEKTEWFLLFYCKELAIFWTCFKQLYRTGAIQHFFYIVGESSKKFDCESCVSR